MSKIGRATVRPIKGHFQQLTAPQCGAKGITMNAMNNAAANASANVNGIDASAAPEWRRHAAAMLGHSDRAAYAGCKFIVCTINRAIHESNMDALNWLRGATASKTPAVRNVAKLCCRIATACLYGIQEVDKKGLTVNDAPALEDWTVETIKNAAASHNWQQRKGAILSFWTGKAPIRIRKSSTQKTAAEKLAAIAKAAAALMEKEGVSMQEVVKAIETAKANRIAK